MDFERFSSLGTSYVLEGTRRLRLINAFFRPMESESILSGKRSSSKVPWKEIFWEGCKFSLTCVGEGSATADPSRLATCPTTLLQWVWNRTLLYVKKKGKIMRFFYVNTKYKLYIKIFPTSMCRILTFVIHSVWYTSIGFVSFTLWLFDSLKKPKE